MKQLRQLTALILLPLIIVIGITHAILGTILHWYIGSLCLGAFTGCGRPDCKGCNAARKLVEEEEESHG